MAQKNSSVSVETLGKMNLPEQKERGNQLLAMDFNSITEAIRTLRKDLVVIQNQFPELDMPARIASAANTGDNDLWAFMPAGITGQIFDGPNNTDDDRVSRLVLEVIDPSEVTTNFEGHYVICAENISPGDIGRVYIGGICPAWAVCSDAGFKYAELVNPDTGNNEDHLTCGTEGTSRIIWFKEASPNEQLIILRLGFTVGGVPLSAVNPDALGTTSEVEAAQTDTWDQSNQGEFEGINVTMQTRTAYNHAGDEKLYAYYRTFKYDVNGRVMTISAETRVEIDAAVDCPA